MRRSLIIMLSLWALALITACSSSDQGENPPPAPSPEQPTVIGAADRALAARAGITADSTILRAITLRQALRKGELRSGAYIYSRTMHYSAQDPIGNADTLIARAALLGLTDLYMSTPKAMVNGSDNNARTWIRAFNAKAHKEGIKVWALRFFNLSDYNSNNDFTRIDGECDALIAYNNAVAEDERFDAYSADYEPHNLKASYSPWPSGLPQTSDYQWNSTTGYGIGGPNDRLLGLTYNMLSRMRAKLGEKAEINEAIAVMYQSRFDNGTLSNGGTSQLLIPCSSIIVMAYLPTAQQIWNKSVPMLDDAKEHPRSVSICIKTSVNSANSETLSPRTWDYMLQCVNYLNDDAQGGNKAAYRGVDFFEYDGLEQIWLSL